VVKWPLKLIEYANLSVRCSSDVALKLVDCADLSVLCCSDVVFKISNLCELICEIWQ